MSTKTAALEYVKTIGIVNNGFNGRGFANPYDIAIGRDDKIFVLNRCDPLRAAAIRVGICTLDDDYLGEFGYGYGDGDGQFIWPVAMAFDSQEQLYVTDEYSNRITVFDTEGKYLAKWGVEGSGPGEISGPAGIAIDAEDNIYIADQHNNRVQKFSLDGTFQNQWGKAGAKEGQFNLPWGVAVDLAFPCAIQNELEEADAKALIDHGVRAVGEGANMPCSPAAVAAFQQNGVLFSPGKASNAGGVAVSGLEQSQNSLRISWSRKEVDDRLQTIMKGIHDRCVEYGTDPGDRPINYVRGANIGGFVKVADAMLAYGIV